MTGYDARAYERDIDLRFKAFPLLHQGELLVEALEPGGALLHSSWTGGVQTRHLGHALRVSPNQLD